MSIRKRAIHAYVATAATALLAGGGLTVGVVTAPSAAAAGSSFTCTAATDFLVANGQLYSAPEPTSPVSTAPAFAKVGGAGPIYNAMGFDPKDNYLYALVDGDVSQPAGYGGNDLLQIDPGTGAITDLGRVPGLLQTQVSGGFDASDNFWVSDGYSIHEIDLTTSPPTVTKTMYVSQGYVTDITYAFGSWWGFNQGYLDEIDPANANVTEEFTPPIPGFDAFNGQAGWTYANGDIGFAWTGGGLSTQWARITGLGGTPSVLYGPTFMSGVTGLAAASNADGASCEPLQVGSPMPAGTYGSSYNESVSVSGGTAPYTVSLVGGSLPPGLTMSSGDITGTPTQAGTYTFTVQESDSNGLFGTGTISLTINPVTLTVTVSGSQSYGGSPTFTQTNDAPSSVTLDASKLSCTTAGGSPLSSLSAGSYTLDGSSCSGIVPPANYKIKYVGAPAGFTVNPVALTLTVTAASASMTYGGPVPSISATYAGFVNGDTSGSLTTPPTCSTTATSSSPVGTYPSSCSGAADPNYSISYADGTVNVTQAALTVTASSGSMWYGGAVPGISATYAGF
ncbi:MAG TPA: MBG domain-containing protein, partial [Streptosporangiaceae bacterium]